MRDLCSDINQDYALFHRDFFKRSELAKETRKADKLKKIYQKALAAKERIDEEVKTASLKLQAQFTILRSL
ncbi:MAG TPA: hypothetical protein VHZ76_00820 [Gammaproteobacteria bacterium]|nr:hypothetical protein [Gammaproteobacteria bacterium]